VKGVRGSSDVSRRGPMRMAATDPFHDPLDDLASEWSGASEDEDRLVWGE
jgi:hypothetical protein